MKLPKTFSLRSFLVLVAVVAIAACWTQYPQMQTVYVNADRSYDYFRRHRGLGVWSPKLPKRVERRTVRRTNFVDLVQDGITTVIDDDGNTLERQTWKDGQLIQTYHYFFDPVSGQLVSEGAVRLGRPDGLWKWWGANPVNRRPQSWREYGKQTTIPENLYMDATLVRRDDETVWIAWGEDDETTIPLQNLNLTGAGIDQLLEGLSPSVAAAEPTHTFEFDNGELLRVDGLVAKKFLYRTPTQGAEALSIRAMLDSITVCRLQQHRPGTRFYRSGAPYVQLFNDYEVDYSKAVPSQAKFITYVGAPLPHQATLYLVLRENGLAIDFRYGILQIVSVKQADEWVDRANFAQFSRLAADVKLRLQQTYVAPDLIYGGYQSTRQAYAISDVFKGIEDAMTNDAGKKMVEFRFSDQIGQRLVRVLPVSDVYTIQQTIAKLIDDNDLECTILLSGHIEIFSRTSGAGREPAIGALE